jgi:hypothetical protein
MAKSYIAQRKIYQVVSHHSGEAKRAKALPSHCFLSNRHRCSGTHRESAGSRLCFLKLLRLGGRDRLQALPVHRRQLLLLRDLLHRHHLSAGRSKVRLRQQMLTPVHASLENLWCIRGIAARRAVSERREDYLNCLRPCLCSRQGLRPPRAAPPHQPCPARPRGKLLPNPRMHSNECRDNLGGRRGGDHHDEHDRRHGCCDHGSPAHHLAIGHG